MKNEEPGARSHTKPKQKEAEAFCSRANKFAMDPEPGPEPPPPPAPAAALEGAAAGNVPGIVGNVGNVVGEELGIQQYGSFQNRDRTELSRNRGPTRHL